VARAEDSFARAVGKRRDVAVGSGSGKGAAVGVSATKDGSTRSLGAAAGDVAEFALPAGAKWLVVKPASSEATLHEAVWKTK
jgi:hypothetical protein